MILPNKYISLSQSYIGLSSLILNILGKKTLTVEKIWAIFNKKYIITKELINPPTLEKMMYTLVFMYSSQMINYTLKGEIYNENI